MQAAIAPADAGPSFLSLKSSDRACSVPFSCSTFRFLASFSPTLRSTSVVVCWTDPPYTNVGVDATVVDASHSVVVNKLLVECSEGIPGGLTYHPWYLNVNVPTAPARNAVASGSMDSVYGVEAPHDNTRVIEFLPRSTNWHVVEFASHGGAAFANGAQDVAVLGERGSCACMYMHTGAEAEAGGSQGVAGGAQGGARHTGAREPVGS